MLTKGDQLQDRANKALHDEKLQKALSVIPEGFVNKRKKAKDACPDFDQLSDIAVEIKNHTLSNVSYYLGVFESALTKSGGTLHYANTGQEALEAITNIARDKKAKLITKGKTMVGEEIGLTAHLQNEGFECVETDLGEYLIQLRGEMPSHIIAPAVHLTREDIRADFKKAHSALPKERTLDIPEDFVKEARAILREKFLKADIGITGANILVAENGMSVLVTNEGNGDLCQSLPKTHIVITSFEKIVPTMEDATILLRLLARSATGQTISTYTTFNGGPKLTPQGQGPEELHVVLLDNGRSQMLASKFHEMLRCIRCGACLNHCPIYQNIGGHAYDSVYPGPMGAVLSPQFFGVDMRQISHASSVCGRCNEVCPMQIPLTNLMRFWREDAASEQSYWAKIMIKLWAGFAKRPKIYNSAVTATLPIIRRAISFKVFVKYIPGLSIWTRHRAVPKLAKTSFQSQWRASQKVKEKGEE